jgi:hypothetical protein
MGYLNVNEPGVVYDVEQIISHPDYDEDTNENDIALLRLVRRPTNDGFTPVKLIIK